MATQDLPPPGGFASIPIKRTYAKGLMSKGLFLGSLVAMSGFGLLNMKEYKRRKRVFIAEQQEHYIALMPFIYAEQERKFLKRLTELREFERMVMKDVPGWTSDGFFGEKIFKTVPHDCIPPLTVSEFYLGRPRNEYLWEAINPDFWH